MNEEEKEEDEIPPTRAQPSPSRHCLGPGVAVKENNQESRRGEGWWKANG